MSAARKDFNFEQNSDFVMKLRFKMKDGTYRDLTGHVFTGMVRKTATDKGPPQANLLFSVPDQSTDDAKGTVVVTLPASESVGMKFDANKTAERVTTAFAYDVRSTKDGVPYRWLYGIATGSPAVDRPDLA